HAAAVGSHPTGPAAGEARRLVVLRFPPLGRDRVSPARARSGGRAVAPLVLSRSRPGTAAQAASRHRAPLAGWPPGQLFVLHLVAHARSGAGSAASRHPPGGDGLL